MVWIVVGVVVLVLAVASPEFRGCLAILAGLAVFGAILVAVWLRYDSNVRLKEEQAAKLRIPRTSIDLLDLRMNTASTFTTLTGRVRNNDRLFELTGIELRLRVEDCEWVIDGVATPGPSADPRARRRCDTVGDAKESVYLSVPPGQMRELNESVYFSGMGSPRGTRTWSYDLMSVSGK